jgi:hypothetical protein
MSSSAMAMRRLSMSSPPRWVSPPVATTSKMPSWSLRMVEGAAAEVVNGDETVAMFIETVGECGRGWLVDEAEDFEAGDAAGVFGGLALGVVEVGGHGDDGLGDGGAEEALGVLLQLQQDIGGDLGRGELKAADLKLEHVCGLEAGDEFEGEQLQFVLHILDAAAHQPLGGVDCARRIGEEGGTSCVADDESAVLIEGDDGRNEAVAIFAGDDGGCVALHEGDERVCGAKIDPNYSRFIFIRHTVFQTSVFFSTANFRGRVTRD